MDAVNLLPLEYRNRKRKRRRRRTNLDGRRTLRIGGSRRGALRRAARRPLLPRAPDRQQQEEGRSPTTQAQIAAVQPQVEAIKTAQAAISGRLTVAQSVAGTRMNWDRALNDFARVIPTNSYLTSIR